MDPAEDEINIFLPMAFGIFLIIIFSIIGVLFWLLRRSKVVEAINKYYFLAVLKAAFLSIVGVFVFSIFAGVFLTIVRKIADFLSK